ncbi:MAG: hypothetical protein ACLFTR_04540 [Candidatus Woesearchaeota archaeon]
MGKRKAEIEIQQLLGWLLVIIALVVLLWLAGKWILSAGSVNPF